MSASRWAQLSASRLPVDLSALERAETAERVRAANDEITRIRSCVDALDARSAAAR